jgi:hypothetical protein
MGMEFGLIKMYSAAKPAIDLVFLHGLTGDPLETWNSENSESFWPNWLAEELPNLDIYTLKYPASLMGKWAKKEMDLFERCNNILENMAGIGLGNRPIVFIAHSLGGIVAKQILRSYTILRLRLQRNSSIDKTHYFSWHSSFRSIIGQCFKLNPRIIKTYTTTK